MKIKPIPPPSKELKKAIEYKKWKDNYLYSFFGTPIRENRKVKATEIRSY